MDSQTVFAKLRDALAHLYPTEESAQRIVHDAGLDARRIHFSAQALENWHAILAEAVRAGRLDALLKVALIDSSSNADLLAAFGSYRHFVERGERLEAPAEPTTGSQRNGDSITATVGEQARNVIIGKNINQTVVEGNTIGTFINNLFRSGAEDVRQQRNRQTMLARVHDIWVKGVLEQSLHGVALLELGLESRPDAVEHPWDMVVQMPDQPSVRLEPGTTIAQVFNEAHSSLLILGEPGSGKTTMLLELARTLIGRAEQDGTQPIPVVFNLSSWAEKRPSIAEWLFEELNTKYSIPRKLAQAWIAQDDLLLLLDGLDEVKEVARTACVKAINAFRQEHLGGLAICCRSEEYASLGAQLKLAGAVRLLPLTADQVDDYLAGAGDKLAAVRALLHHDPVLQELAESPLTLSVMALAYQDKPVQEIQLSSALESRRSHLFDAYIERMFVRSGRSHSVSYIRAQTLHWLGWLAGRLLQHGQTLFLIEQLQPSWSQTTRSSRFFVTAAMLMWGPLYGLLGVLMWGLIFGVLGGLLGGAFFGLLGMSLFGLAVGLTFGLIAGLIFSLGEGLVVGLLFGIVEGLSGRFRKIQLNERLISPWRRLRSSLYATLFYGLIGGLVIGGPGTLRTVSVFALLSGLSGGFVGGFREVHLANPLKLSWKRLKSSLTFGLFVGLGAGLFEGLVFGIGQGLIFGLGYGLFVGLAVGLSGGLIGGLFFEPSENLEIQNTSATQQPNQGIKLLAKSSIITHLVFGLIFGPIFGSSFGLSHGLYDGFFSGSFSVLFFGLIGGAISGGDVVTKHYILRLILWWKRYAPLNYARFLDYCADRIFLRKAGGSYIFIHRLLMEHFASLTEEDIKRLAGVDNTKRS